MTSKSKNGSYSVGTFAQKIVKTDMLKVKKSVYVPCEMDKVLNCTLWHLN